MARRIALFNHKGGVSKTTTTFHLGWMLAEMGKRVVMVDADPQCNLTGLLLGFKGPSELEKFYKSNPGRNIKAALEPAFESRPTPIKGVECVEITERPGLYLLPGHIAFAEYEVQLGIAQELTGAIQALQNLPGSLSFLLDETAKRHKADYVIIDMSPSLSSVNQNLFTTSDYFLVPTSPDFFSVMAIGSLASVIPRWATWARLASGLHILKNATYPFPSLSPKFLGIIVQKFRPRGGVPAQGFKHWINELSVAVDKSLIPALTKAGLLLDRKRYKHVGLDKGYVLSNIADFNTLITRSQDTQTPVFALTQEQLQQEGIVLQGSREAMKAFHATFKDLAERIVGLTA